MEWTKGKVMMNIRTFVKVESIRGELVYHQNRTYIAESVEKWFGNTFRHV